MIKLILSVAALSVASAIFFMYTQPTYDGVKQIKQQIREYDQALDKAAELQQLKQSFLSRYNAFNPTDIAHLQKMLPDHVDNVRLVLDLDNLAGRHGMALQNVVISNPVSDTGDGSVLGTIGAARQKFDSLTLRFSTSATYNSFVQFLEELESSLRVTDLVALNLVPDTSASDTSEPKYRFDITIRTYWLK